MKARGLVLGLLVLVLLCLFVVRELRTDKETGKMLPGALIFPHGTADVSSFVLRISEVGEASFQRRAEGGWETVRGPETADPTFAPDVLSGWSQVRLAQVVDDAPTDTDLERYGLSEPLLRIEAEVRDRESGETVRPSLEVGRPSPIVNAFYARIDDRERVILVTPDVVNLMSHSGPDAFGIPRPPSAAPPARR